MQASFRLYQLSLSYSFHLLNSPLDSMIHFLIPTFKYSTIPSYFLLCQSAFAVTACANWKNLRKKIPEAEFWEHQGCYWKYLHIRRSNTYNCFISTVECDKAQSTFWRIAPVTQIILKLDEHCHFQKHILSLVPLALFFILFFFCFLITDSCWPITYYFHLILKGNCWIYYILSSKHVYGL